MVARASSASEGEMFMILSCRELYITKYSILQSNNISEISVCQDGVVPLAASSHPGKIIPDIIIWERIRKPVFKPQINADKQDMAFYTQEFHSTVQIYIERPSQQKNLRPSVFICGF
jgi:hypothetical protein